MIKFVRKLFVFPNRRKEWAVTGEFGSLSFWYKEHPEELKGKLGEDGYGGVETHYNEKSKPDYLGKCDHECCHINGGKCWHDGTSLWAQEYWIPNVMPHGDEYIWQMLEFNYDLKNKDTTGEQND